MAKIGPAHAPPGRILRHLPCLLRSALVVGVAHGPRWLPGGRRAKRQGAAPGILAVMDPGSVAGSGELDRIRDLCEGLGGTLAGGDLLAWAGSGDVSAGNGIIVTLIGFEGGD
jgi:hypothetical protein